MELPEDLQLEIERIELVKKNSVQQLVRVAITLSKTDNIPEEQLVELFDENCLGGLQHNASNTSYLISELNKLVTDQPALESSISSFFEFCRTF